MYIKRAQNDFRSGEGSAQNVIKKLQHPLKIGFFDEKMK